MKAKKLTGTVLGVAIVTAAGWWFFSEPNPKLYRFGAGSANSNQQSFSYADYAAVLNAYVNDQGMVDYRLLKADRQRLDAFASALAQLAPSTYEHWSEKEKIAFWINAYNALTLEAIINHYPIKSSFFRSVVFPKNSIRQIPGVWDTLQFMVMGRKRTLGEIEHEILRQQFNEPRIHMALVCAAMGCPPLRNEPFFGDQLDEQLNDQTRRFLSDSTMFRMDRSQGRVYLSSIFKWFGRDFIKIYGTDQKLAGHDPAERAVLNFISRHLDASDREYLATAKYNVEYLGYDWSLNEQTTGKEIS